MKSSEQYPLLLNCSFLSESEYQERIQQALEQDALTHIVTLNAEMIVEAQTNPEFRSAVHKAELKIPDGSSLFWAKEYLESISPPRTRGSEKGSKIRVIASLIKFFFSKQQPLTGVDSVFTICEAVERKRGTVYLLGGTKEEAQGTAGALRKRYRKINVITLPDPTPSNSPLVRGRERAFPLLTKEGLGEVSVLLVAFGSPKQTLYIEQHRKILEQTGVKIAIGVGGAFAMISGTLPRAPHFMRRHHLELLWRLMLEPKRIKRIWNAVFVFPNIIRGYPH